LRKESCCAVATFEKNVFQPQEKSDLAMRFLSLYVSTQKCKDLNFEIWKIWQNCSLNQFSSARRLHPADMLERWPQVCRVKIMFTKLLTNRFVSMKTNSMKCLDWLMLLLLLRKK